MFKGPRTTWENIIFSKKSVVFFFLVVVFGKICWILSPANLTKTLMEKIPFWGIEERFGESGWSREIWSNLERWKMKHGHDWKFTLSYLYHWSSFFCYYAALFQSAQHFKSKQASIQPLELGMFWGICRLPVKQRETMYSSPTLSTRRIPKMTTPARKSVFKKQYLNKNSLTQVTGRWFHVCFFRKGTPLKNEPLATPNLYGFGFKIRYEFPVLGYVLLEVIGSKDQWVRDTPYYSPCIS